MVVAPLSLRRGRPSPASEGDENDRLVVLRIDRTRRRRGIDFRGGRKCELRQPAMCADSAICRIHSSSLLFMRFFTSAIQLTLSVCAMALYPIHCE